MAADEERSITWELVGLCERPFIAISLLVTPANKDFSILSVMDNILLVIEG